MNKGEWREVKIPGDSYHEYTINGACCARIKTYPSDSIYARGDEFFARIMPDSEHSALLDLRLMCLEEMKAHVEKALELLYITLGGQSGEEGE